MIDCNRKKAQAIRGWAQGRHKLQRGFIPSLTYSAHRIFHPDFKRAIDAFIQEEKIMLDQIMKEDQQRSPYKD